jgi:hypothetical protein
MWRSGHRRSYAYETATAVFQRIERDLSAAKSQFWNTDADAYDPRVQFRVDVDYAFDDPPLQVARGPQQRLRFVRAIPEDTLNPRLRQAGDGLNNDGDVADTNDNGVLEPAIDAPLIDEEYYNQMDDPQDDLDVDGRLDYADGFVDEDLRPLEGMCEVAYLMGLGAGSQHTLFRGVLAPIGETQPVPTLRSLRPEGWNVTFFNDAYIDNERIGGSGTAVYAPEIENKAVALTEDVVLHFELRLWSQYTTTWDDEVGFGPWPDSHTMVPCGPAFFWDSRGVHRDPEDPVEWRDNVFPRALMAVLVVEPPARLRAQGRLRLREDIDAHDLQIPVNGPLPAYNASWPYILLRNPSGEEWVRFSTFDEVSQSFNLDPNDPLGTRGVRRTWAHGHPAGTEVLFGYTLSSVFHNPTGREYWGQ